MKMLYAIMNSRRLVGATTLLLVLIGALSFATMPRQEDPFFPYRGGVIRTVFPGADAERIRELVVRHLEREISEIADLDFVRSTVRNNVALTTVVMRDFIYDTNAKWDEVRRAMVRAAEQFPPGVITPTLDDRVITTTTATYAVMGGDGDLQGMAVAAKRLRDALTQLGKLIRIDLHGDPEEQVTIGLEDETAQRYGISPQYLAGQLAGRLQLLGAGTLVAGSTRMTLKPETEFRSIDELRETPVSLPSGDVLPLAALAEVWLGPKQPATARMWHDGKPAVLVDVIAAQNNLNTVAYGRRVRAEVEAMRAALAPYEIREMFFQPDRVEERLDGLSSSLLWAVGIILLVLIVAMGPRLALLVAVILPTVAGITVAVYALGGGVLHQMAVIGMIIALGILVDNAIVMIEEVQWQLNQGHAPMKAAVRAARTLAKPLAAATGTTLAAFVPLVLSKSGVGDFTRAVPIMIMSSLVISYLFALVVTPMLGAAFLRPKRNADGTAQTGWPERFGAWAGRIGNNHAVLVLIVAVLMIGGAMFYAANNLERQFFPLADRDQVLVDIAMSEGTTQEETTRVARILERQLRSHDDVLEVHAFIGNSGPRFFYNLLRRPDQPNLARLVVKSTGLFKNDSIIAAVREFSVQNLPEARVVAKVLAQGPPTDAPIELRVFNPNPERLAEATETILTAVQGTPGAIDAAHNLGLGAPQLRFEIDDAHALEYGLSRADIARALLGRSAGIHIGQYRMSEEPVPILIRSMAGENYDPAQLESVLVFNAKGEGIPLGAVASTSLSWQPGAIYSWNQRRYSLVSAELDFGFVFSQVLDDLQPKLDALQLPPGTSYEFGGEAEASGDANSAIVGVAPFGVVLLLFCLIWQFNSFRRLLIVLTTIPLACVGVFPGLALLGIPFGFQPLLGSIALIGIVVNNAIVLIDVLDSNLNADQSFDDAIRNAVERRTRPILLTTATTIAGLLPLAFSESTMWPPTAWPIITGLTASTLLTLFVVPAMCRLLLRPGRRSKLHIGEKALPVTSALLVAVVLLGGSERALAAEPLSLPAAMQAAQQQPAVQAEVFAHRAAVALATVERRATWWPQVGASYRYLHVDSLAAFETPFGRQRLGEHQSHRGEVSLTQPLLNWSRSRYLVPAAEAEAEAQLARSARAAEGAAMTAATLYLNQLQLQAQREANAALESSFAARLKRVQALVEGGRALKADALDVRLARNDSRQALAQIDAQMQVLARELAYATGQPAERFLQLEPPALAVSLPERAQALATAEVHRAELQALSAQAQALGLRASATRAEALPTLGAQLSYIRSDGDALGPDEDTRAAVQLEWQAFAGGTRRARVDALKAQQLRAQAALADQRQRIEVEIARAYEDLQLALTTERLSQEAVESSTLRLKTRNDRFDAGRETVDEVLEAEAQLRLQETRLRNAGYSALLARLQGRFALGLPLLDAP